MSLSERWPLNSYEVITSKWRSQTAYGFRNVFSTEDTATLLAMRTIHITGGTDATNSDLILWLQANGTLQQSTDLTDTLQRFDLQPSLSNVGTKSINFISGGVNYSSITISTNGIMYDNVLAYGESASYPAKGDIVAVDMDGDGTPEKYRVLKNVSGTVYELLSLSAPSNSSVYWDDTNWSTFYSGSGPDVFCNTTWYNTLSSTAKSAIVDKTFTQDSWYKSWSEPTPGSPSYAGWTFSSTHGSVDWYYVSLGSASYGSSITRHVYVMSVQDVLDYLEVTPDMEVTTLTESNVAMMMGAVELTNTWLRSADAESDTYSTWCLDASAPFISEVATYPISVHPTFQIDLSQISWSSTTAGYPVNIGVAYNASSSNSYSFYDGLDSTAPLIDTIPRGTSRSYVVTSGHIYSNIGSQTLSLEGDLTSSDTSGEIHVTVSGYGDLLVQ